VPNSFLIGGKVEDKKSKTEEFIQRAIEKHGDKYDYSKVDYKNAHSKVKITCRNHGEFLQQPNNHLQGKGCGGCKREKAIETSTKHGCGKAGNRTREYRSWQSMRERCYCENNKKYHRYGGRGIKVCDRWKNSFENFLADMGASPAKTTIDRLDNDGDYCPENCRWANSEQQANNTSTNRLLTIYGKTMTLSCWTKVNPYVKPATASMRLRRGWTPKEAIYGKPR
jgi:hypothetical protein